MGIFTVLTLLKMSDQKGVHFSKKWSYRGIIVDFDRFWSEKVTRYDPFSALFRDLLKNTEMDGGGGVQWLRAGE